MDVYDSDGVFVGQLTVDKADRKSLLVNPGGHGDLPVVAIATEIAASVALADCPTFDLGGYEPVLELVVAGTGDWSVQPYFADEDDDDAFLIPASLEALGYGSFGYTNVGNPAIAATEAGTYRFCKIPRLGRYVRYVPTLIGEGTLTIKAGGTI